VKKSVLIVFAILALCSLLLTNVVAVNAAAASGYTRTDTPTNTEYANTVDGAWDPVEEWFDAQFTGNVSTIIDFGSTWDMGDYVTSRWIVEFFNDNTTDAGDYWEIDVDNADGGGAEPASTNFKIRIDGHETLTVYQGNAGAWDPITPEADELIWNNSITTTPWSSDPHWVLEIDIAKNGPTAFAGPTWGVRVAAYDDSNPGQGEVAWPPESSADVPDGWATQGYTSDPYWFVPEGLSIAIVVLLSSAAVAVSLYSLRKRPKISKIDYKL
jgi:hypothetical protein